MNDRHRKVIVVILANAGASAFAITLIRFGWIKNILALVLSSFLAGTLGYLTFAWLGNQLMRLQKRLAFEQPGKAVYAFGKLPPGEAVSAGGKGRALAQLWQAGFLTAWGSWHEAHRPWVGPRPRVAATLPWWQVAHVDHHFRGARCGLWQEPHWCLEALTPCAWLPWQVAQALTWRG